MLRSLVGSEMCIRDRPVGVVTSVDDSTGTLTQTATVNSYANLNDLGVVSVIVSAPTTAPTTPILPTPNPVVTVYVTPAPAPAPLLSPGATASANPTPTPTPSAVPTKKK